MLDAILPASPSPYHQTIQTSINDSHILQGHLWGTMLSTHFLKLLINGLVNSSRFSGLSDFYDHFEPKKLAILLPQLRETLIIFFVKETIFPSNVVAEILGPKGAPGRLSRAECHQ